MEMKLLEIRDRGTFIPVIAISSLPSEEGEDYLLRRLGFAPSQPCVILVSLNHRRAHYDPYDWAGSRTMQTAHFFIEKNFPSLSSGDVIDVEYILGETPLPKLSERFGDHNPTHPTHPLKEKA